MCSEKCLDQIQNGQLEAIIDFNMSNIEKTVRDSQIIFSKTKCIVSVRGMRLKISS